MIYFRNWKSGSRLWLLAFAIVGVVMFVFENKLGHSTMDITEQHVYEAEKNQVKMAVNLIEVFEQNKRDEVARFSKLFESYFNAPVIADKKTTTNAGGREIPTLRLHGKSLHYDYAIPDRFTAQSGEVATIFAKAGDDFVRISTSLRKPGGERAVGTWLKRSHPSYKLLLAGEKYAGLATLFGVQYMTEYLPIFNAHGKVIGVKFVGVDVTRDIASLKSKLNSIKIGKTGHLYALDAEKGPKFGALVFHPTAEGDNILDRRDVNGRAYVKEMLAAKSGTAKIKLKNQNNDATNLLVAFEYFKERNWLIVAQVPEAEMLGDIARMRNTYSAISVGAILILAGIMMMAVISMGRDIAERKRVERALRLAQFSVDQAAFPIFWITADARIQFANDAAGDLLGYTGLELQSLSVLDLVQDYSNELWRKDWQSLKVENARSMELTLLNRHRQPISIEVNSNYLEYDGVEYDFAFLRDVTEKKRAEERIWHQANYDSLTELPNRRLFMDRLNQETLKSARNGLQLALLFIDLDGFKDVNDMLGHDTGDALLKEVANRLKACTREADTVARLGGDEFTVIMGNLQTRTPIERVCQAIIERLSVPFNVNGESAHISASIGITVYPDDASTIEDLLINADHAMYSAKEQGRSRSQYFTDAMHTAAQKRKHLVMDMRHALEDKQFHVVYQPIVDLSTGEVQKAEALVRWAHPDHGLINPSDFIPIAEETGMIHVLGEQVFEISANQAGVWRKTLHPEFQVSVNLSPVQLRRDDQTSMGWLNFIKSARLTGASVVAEITESALLDASESVADQLLSFRDAGIQVAIDDFGTGYSSLSYLRKFDIDYLKIDRSFVSGLVPGSDDLALCEAIIVMAHKLDIHVIAEGVETPLQRDLLIQAGCDYAQGYLFSKPIKAKDFEALFDAGRKTNRNFLKL